MKHELKISSQYFYALLDGSKTFEVLGDIFGFAVGDTLVLREWGSTADEIFGGPYTGRQCERTVTYVLRGPEFGIRGGCCVVGLSDPAREKRIAALETDIELLGKIAAVAQNIYSSICMGHPGYESLYESLVRHDPPAGIHKLHELLDGNHTNLTLVEQGRLAVFERIASAAQRYRTAVMNSGPIILDEDWDYNAAMNELEQACKALEEMVT